MNTEELFQEYTNLKKKYIELRLDQIGGSNFEFKEKLLPVVQLLYDNSVLNDSDSKNEYNWKISGDGDYTDRYKKSIKANTTNFVNDVKNENLPTHIHDIVKLKFYFYIMHDLIIDSKRGIFTTRPGGTHLDPRLISLTNIEDRNSFFIEYLKIIKQKVDELEYKIDPDKLLTYNKNIIIKIIDNLLKTFEYLQLFFKKCFEKINKTEIAQLKENEIFNEIEENPSLIKLTTPQEFIIRKTINNLIKENKKEYDPYISLSDDEKKKLDELAKIKK